MAFGFWDDDDNDDDDDVVVDVIDVIKPCDFYSTVIIVYII